MITRRSCSAEPSLFRQTFFRIFDLKKEISKMNRNHYLFIALTSILLGLSLSSLSLRPVHAQASPRGSAELTLNGKKISVDYGRPYMRGRKIMGELVPYGQVWRTGANKATHLTTEADLVIGGVAVPAGTYTLFTVPSQSGWKLIVNKRTGQWGIPYSYEKEELARIDMKVEKLPSAIEQFTISLDKDGAGGILKMEWETTRASVKFTAK
jgi:hypothetical protein